MAVQIQLRNGTAAAWTAANPTLAIGEVGIETDTNKTKIGNGATAWNSLAYTNSGTVTTVSIASANGLAGTVANATTTPTVTLSTTVTGVLKGNGTAISAATAGTDYLAPPSGTSILKGNSGGALANATAGTDYQAPITLTTTGTSGAATFVGNTLNIPQYTGGGGGGGPILESQIVISQNYTLTSNTNGLSISPVTVATGYAVTVPTGQVWLIWST
jgi:hypothetical protein